MVCDILICAQIEHRRFGDIDLEREETTRGRRESLKESERWTS